LAVNAAKLAQAVDRLGDASARLSAGAEPQHERTETPGQSPATMAQQEAEAADATDRE
jgi:hypothetical protein